MGNNTIFAGFQLVENVTIQYNQYRKVKKGCKYYVHRESVNGKKGEKRCPILIQ